MQPISLRPGICVRAAAITLAAALTAGCAGMHESKDFERHRYSQLSEPRDGKGDALYFDVMIDAKYPGDDPVAEDIRMTWLEAWLEVRKMCPDGYRIDDKRDFDPMEYNPARYDTRYVIKCTPAPLS